VVTRLRLDAALYHPAPERQAQQMGRPRKVGKRLPALKASSRTLTPWGDKGGFQLVARVTIPYKSLRRCGITWTACPDSLSVDPRPEGQFPPQALLCTDLWLNPAKSCIGSALANRSDLCEVRAHLALKLKGSGLS